MKTTYASLHPCSHHLNSRDLFPWQWAGLLLSFCLSLPAARGASFQGLGDLPGGGFSSTPGGMSNDGQVVVGTGTTASGGQAFRWTPATGMVSLGNLPNNGFLSSGAGRLLGDGQVIIGSGTTASGAQLFRWTPATGMASLGSPPNGSYVSIDIGGISSDGTIIVGSANPTAQYNYTAGRGLRWTQATGMEDLSSVLGTTIIDVFISSDGSVLAGRGGNGYQAFRWTQNGGLVLGVGALPGHPYGRVIGMSVDGSVIVGACYTSTGFSNEKTYRWTQAGGPQDIGVLPGYTYGDFPNAISPDGSVIVGTAYSSATNCIAYRWTQSGGLTAIGGVPGRTVNHPQAVSADGRIIVGTGIIPPADFIAFIWDETHGLRLLKQALEADYGLNLTGWTLQQATGITPDGSVIIGFGTNPSGQQEAFRVVLDVPPTIQTQPVSQHVAPGSSATFSVTASGTGPLTYQWKLGGTAIAGATSASCTVANAQAGNMGFYSVTVSNSSGTVDSDVAILTVAAGSSRLTGLSTRGYLPAGGSLTPGFFLRGGGSKSVIVRAVGPRLGDFGVAGPLSDPRMDLIPFGLTTPLLSNDDWGTNPDLPALRAAMPFALTEGSRDAAALATLSTAVNTGYTVRIVPTGAATAGIAMAEVYDLDATTSPVQFASLATLGFTGTGENLLTPGIIITGDGPKQLLIRAVGPTLAGYGVGGVLADPQFRVVPLGQDFTVAGNDNWGGTAALQAAFTQVSAFALPVDSRDAALVVRLPPGGYTVQATGVGGTTGNVIVEVYDMDP